MEPGGKVRGWTREGVFSPEDRVVSMPRAEQAMPNMCARVKLTKMQMAMTMQGMMADL